MVFFNLSANHAFAIKLSFGCLCAWERGASHEPVLHRRGSSQIINSITILSLTESSVATFIPRVTIPSGL